MEAKLLKLIIASHNQGKIKEFKRFFEPFDVEVVALDAFPNIPEVKEIGTTFEENARLKAETIAKQLGVIVLADDSGLVVPALNGAPGVYSARYAGEPSNSKRNNEKLIDEMQSLVGDERQAYFVSCLVLAHPEYDSLVVEGHAHGVILDALQGTEGFGYDPLFYVEDEGQTFAEMGIDRKNEISHRAIALKQLMHDFPKWLEEVKQHEISRHE